MNLNADKSDAANDIVGEWTSRGNRFVCKRTKYSQLRCNESLVTALDDLTVTNRKINENSEKTGIISSNGMEIAWIGNEKWHKIGLKISIII